MIELASHVSGETLYFYANTHRFDTGVATDADSPPAYRVYRMEDGTPVVTGSMALLDSVNTAGFYSEAVSLAGYDPGEYACYISATVNAIVGTKSFPFTVGQGAGATLVRTTIATLAGQTSFTLTGGPADNNALNRCLIVVRDAVNVDQFCYGLISAYTGATKTVTLASDPGIFTMAIGDFVEVIAVPRQLPNAEAEAAGGLYTRGTGAGQINQPANGLIDTNVENWNATAVPAEHTAGYPIVTIKDGIGTGEIDTNAGAVVAVTTVTNLTNAPTAGDLTATMKTSVNAEVDTAIADARLDELVAADSDIDGAAPPAVGSVFHELMSKTAGSFTFDQLTDSNEAIRDATLDAAGVRSAVGLAAANLDTQLTAIDDAVDTEVAAILAAVDTEVGAIKAVTDLLPNAGALTTIQADLDDIQTRIPAALSGGNMKSDVLAINAVAASAQNLERSASVIVRGSAVTGTLSTTQMTTDLTEATNDHYNGRVIIWTSGTLLGQATNITDYVGASKMLTFTAVTEAPLNGDTFVII